jgi:hypothetical protein
MRRSLAVLLLALSPLPALAADWYVGAGALAELDNRTPSFGGQRVDAESAASVFGGLRFDNGFGLEASWVDLGRARVSAIADAGYDVDGDLVALGLTWAPDTGDLQPYAKLGWFSRSEDGTALTIAGPRPIDFDDDGLMAELGGRWFVTPSFALRGGYSWYDFDVESDGSAMLAAEWHFR